MNRISSTLDNIKQFIKDYGWGYTFIALPVILFTTFKLIPVVYSFIMSFQKYKPIGSKWIGFANYIDALKDPLFWKSMKVTVIYTIGTVPVNLFITLLMSVFIFQLSKKSQTFFKSAFYLPGVASGVTMALVWKLILDPTDSGLFNMVRNALGLEAISWLGDPDLALYTLIFITYFSASGSGILLYTASLGSIPNSLYEAADIDAASSWKNL